MKVVIVLDTEDEQGMRDAYRIARELYTTKGTRFHASTTTVKVNKIQFIKTLREFGAEAVNEFCEKFDVCRTPAAVRWKPSLKLSKQAVDIYFDENV
tara:strand:+ start:5662 stop:5952 length:291 start_codon:yes stop_codon:yes gene_type:complete